MSIPRLHVIAADGVTERDDFVSTARSLLEAYGERIALQLRGHGRPGAWLYARAAALAPAARESGALLVLNDRIDVALAAGAGGVQLGARSLPVEAARALVGPEVPIGYSAHSAEEAARAVEAGADWVLAGTVYETASHPERVGAGPALVREFAERVRVPIVAIGGITPERVAEVVAAGASGVAVLGAVWRSADPLGSAGALLDALAAALEA